MKTSPMTPTQLDPSRRQFLRQSAALGLGIAASAALSSCGLLDDREVVAGTLQELDKQSFLTAQLNDSRVFVARQNDTHTLYALNLTCTHKGCTVKLETADGGGSQFRCPCHKGRYALMGEVLEGKPPRNLSRLKVEVRGQQVVVFNQELPEANA